MTEKESAKKMVKEAKAELDKRIAEAIQILNNNKALALELKALSSSDTYPIRSVQHWANGEHLPITAHHIEQIITALDLLDVDIVSIENLYEQWLDAKDKTRNGEPAISFTYRHDKENPFRIPRVPNGTTTFYGNSWELIELPWDEAPDIWTTAYDIRDRLPDIVIKNVRLKDMMPCNEHLDIMQMIKNENIRHTDILHIASRYQECTGYSYPCCHTYASTYNLAINYCSKYGFDEEYWLAMIDKWNPDENAAVAPSPGYHSFLVESVVEKFVHVMGGIKYCDHYILPEKTEKQEDGATEETTPIFKTKDADNISLEDLLIKSLKENGYNIVAIEPPYTNKEPICYDDEILGLNPRSFIGKFKAVLSRIV